MFGVKTSLLEAAALVGLGIIIENPEKRKMVIGTLDKLGVSAGSALKGLLPKGGALNAPQSDTEQ